MTENVLALDKTWTPHQWITIQDAIVLEAKELVLDRPGEKIHVWHGGYNRNGERSMITTASIIVVDGLASTKRYREPVLTNAALWRRDCFLCAYCGQVFRASELTRDHVHPTSKGGKNTWMNSVTACKPCNALKGDVVPGQKLSSGTLGPQLTGKMEPLYVPYVPCKAEHMILRQRSIKADQMEFLLHMISNKSSRVHKYAEQFALKSNN